MLIRVARTSQPRLASITPRQQRRYVRPDHLHRPRLTARGTGGRRQYNTLRAMAPRPRAFSGPAPRVLIFPRPAVDRLPWHDCIPWRWQPPFVFWQLCWRCSSRRLRMRCLRPLCRSQCARGMGRRRCRRNSWQASSRIRSSRGRRIARRIRL